MVLYSFFGTCKLHHLNPRQWLTDTLRRTPEHNIQKLHQLLPGYKKIRCSCSDGYYITDLHSTFAKVKKIKKDANNKDIADTATQNAYTLITDRSEIADTDTDFITKPNKADFDAKSYLYAHTEVVDGKSKLTIQFSKQLVGKKIQLEPFRGNPGLTNVKNYVKTITYREGKTKNC